MIAVRIIAALCLVLLNGFFVAAEFSLARARLTRLDQMVHDEVASASLATEQVRHIDRYLAACQLGVTLASLGLGWLGAPAFTALLGPLFSGVGLGAESSAVIAGIIAFFIITVLHVVVGELAPKNLAIQRAEITALRAARPLEAFQFVLGPLISVLNNAANRLIGWFGIEPATAHELASTPEDLQRLIAQSEEGGTIEPEEADMLEGVFSLGERVASDVMTPRPEVRDLAADQPISDALTDALASRHSRFPVRGADGIIGVVHLSDLARALIEDDVPSDVRAVSRPAIFVPETQLLDDLLRQLQRERSSLAVVLDEYGELAGIVTVEDIIEEIVGEIDDERDRTPAIATQLDGRLVVRGHASLEDLIDYGVEVADEDVTSVGGLVFARLGRLPRTGDSVTVDGWQFTVEATRGTRVVLVAIDMAPEHEPTA